MGGFSNEFENLILDHIFKNTAYGQPTNLYVALSTATLTDTCTGGTLAGEQSGAGYVRKQCNTWDVAAGGATENTSGIVWAQATADYDGKIISFAICDHLTTGNVIAWGTLTTSKTVSNGDTPRFATGDLDITLT